jgi:hypothetical protein
MATTYGLTSLGFTPKPLTVVRTEVESVLRTLIGPLVLGDVSWLGQVVGVFAERESVVWDLAQLLYAAFDPDSATGASLDAVCALTGTLRLAAAPSTTPLTLTGTPTTLVPAGRLAHASSSNKQFETEADATIGSLTAWVTSHAYSVGDRVTNSGRVYQATAAGTSAVSGSGPTSTLSSISDGLGALVWEYVGDGTGAVDVEAECTVTGAVTAIAGDIINIDTPLAGLSGVRNLSDATPGRDIATDQELRLLRAQELAGDGAGTADAIRAVLLELKFFDGSQPSAVTVFVNETDTTNSDGVPPHAIEALVQCTDDATHNQAVADLLLAQVAAGIATHGTTVTTSTDSQGVPHTIEFTHPALIDVWVVITLGYDSTAYPSDGDVEVQAAIASPTRTIGVDGVASKTGALAFGVNGVLDVTEVLIFNDVIGTAVAWASTTAYSATAGARSVVSNDGRKYICTIAGTSAGSGGPVGTGTDIVDGTAHWCFLGNPVAISTRQIASFGTSRVTVHSAPETP